MRQRESLAILRKSNAFQPKICLKNQTGIVLLGRSPNCVKICSGAGKEIVQTFREDLQSLWQKIRNAQAVQKLTLVINQTSSAAITDNLGKTETDRFKDNCPQR